LKEYTYERKKRVMVVERCMRYYRLRPTGESLEQATDGHDGNWLG